MHDLLLQKSDGRFDLVIWNEKASGSNEVSIDLELVRSSVKIYDPTIGTEPTQTLSSARSVPLTLSDHPVVLEVDDGQR